MSAVEELSPIAIESIKLSALIDHQSTVEASETVENVYAWFQRNQHEFVGVVRNSKLAGLVSRGQVGFLLGARYGVAIYGRQPIGMHLIEGALHFSSSSSLLEVLDSTISRTQEKFYDDVALTDDEDNFLGIITVPTLVRWQSRLILEKNHQAEAQHRVLQESNQQLFRSLNELRQSRGRYEILFETSALGIALVNSLGEIETCNRRLELLLGMEAQALPSPENPRNLKYFFSTKEWPLFLGLLREHELTSDQPNPKTSEFLLLLPGRGPRLFKFFSNWIPETGQICLLLDDITEQRVIEHRMIQKEKSAMLDSLVGGIAHEINNKLAPIVGFVDLLEEEVSNHPDFKILTSYCETIRSAALESAKIIRQLLQLSRPPIRELSVVNLTTIFNEVQSLIGLRMRETQCKVETDFGGFTPLVYADAAQIKQVIINLLFNALDAMESAPTRRLRVTITPSQNAWNLRLADNGHGIKPEHLKRIFNPFFTTKPVDRGSGLGLSVCMSIMKSHGGEIAAENLPEGGAAFTVTLPEATEDHIKTTRTVNLTEAAKNVTSGELQTPQRIRILVADDEEYVTAMVQAVLRKEFSCLVERAATGEIAIARLRQTNFELVISDVRMPGTDGFALYDWVLKHQPQLVTRFLFITGDAGSSDLNEQLESLPAPVLRKPFEMETLLKKCRELLQQQTA